MVAVTGGKGGGKGKRKGGTTRGSGGKALKRPSAKVGRDGPLVLAHGLQDVQLKPYDLIKFKAMMDSPENFMSVPPEIHAEWMALKNVKGNKGQHDAQDAIRRAWKLDASWGHPMITQKIQKTHSKSIKVMNKAMIWQRICTKWGGIDNAKEALLNKDILCVTNPHDVNKRLYIMREHVNEEMWQSASMLSGTSSAEADNEAEVEHMVAQWMQANDGGWDGILNWTEDADHAPMPVAPAQPMPSPPPAQPMPMPLSADPHYNGGPTPEAKMESAIKRLLSHVCSIKSRPVSVPVLYQYQYMYQYQYSYKC